MGPVPSMINHGAKSYITALNLYIFHFVNDAVWIMVLCLTFYLYLKVLWMCKTSYTESGPPVTPPVTLG